MLPVYRMFVCTTPHKYFKNSSFNEHLLFREQAASTVKEESNHEWRIRRKSIKVSRKLMSRNRWINYLTLSGTPHIYTYIKSGLFMAQ